MLVKLRLNILVWIETWRGYKGTKNVAFGYEMSKLGNSNNFLYITLIEYSWIYSK